MSASSYPYVVVGGGNAAGYAAKAFVEAGATDGQVCVLGDEPYVSYERPALSKAYLFPEKPARLPGFHTCVGGGGERQEPEWYAQKGVDFRTNAKVVRVDAKAKEVHTDAGDVVKYEKLVMATGARPTDLYNDFKMEGADGTGIYYLRDVTDADQIVQGIQTAKQGGGKAVVIGGGYIGLECAAALCLNGLDVTVIFPEDYIMQRIFPKEISEFYEKYYETKGVKFLKGRVISLFSCNDSGKICKVNLKDGMELPCDMVVAGVGARPNVEMLEGQVEMEAGGIKVNGQMQSSDPNIFAIGDIAAFPLLCEGGKVQRSEHVVNARLTAAHAVKSIMEPKAKAEYDYLPYFYSRVFDLSWQLYGINEGDHVMFGNPEEKKFGAYWIRDGKVVGAFMEGGSAEDFENMKKVAKARPAAPSKEDLQSMGPDFASKL